MLSINRTNPNNVLLELGGGSNPIVHPRCLGGPDVNIDARFPCNNVEGKQCVDILVDFNQPLPLKDSEFDGVVSHFSLEHVSFRNVPQLLKEVFRVCKPGAKVIFVVPNTEAQLQWIKNHPDGWDNKNLFVAASELLYGSQDYSENSHCCYFSPVIVQRLFQEAGFVSVKTQPYPPNDRGTDLMIEAVVPATYAEMEKHYPMPGNDVRRRKFLGLSETHRDEAKAVDSAKAVVSVPGQSSARQMALETVHYNPDPYRSSPFCDENGVLLSGKIAATHRDWNEVTCPQCLSLKAVMGKSSRKARMEVIDYARDAQDFEPVVSLPPEPMRPNPVQGPVPLVMPEPVAIAMNDFANACKTGQIVAMNKDGYIRTGGDVVTPESFAREQLFDRVYFNGGGKVGGYAREGLWDFPIHNVTAAHILARKPESVLELGPSRGYVLKRIQDAGICGVGLEISKHCYMARVCEGVYLQDLCVTPWPLHSAPDGKYDLCCHPETLIHTTEGLRRIDEVKEGDSVLTHRGRYRKVARLYKRKYRGELVSVRPVSFGWGLVKLTPNHPVLAKQTDYREQRHSQHRHLLPVESFVEVGKLSTDDVSVFSFPNEVADVEWINMEDIPQPETFSAYKEVMDLRQRGKSLYKIKDECGVAVKTAHQWVTGTKWPRGCWQIRNGKWYSSSLDLQGMPIRTSVDGDFCRFVGYFLSDGCSNTANSHTTFVFGEKEILFVEDVENITLRLWGLKSRRSSRGKAIVIEFDSQGLTRLIAHFVTKEKALKKGIPHWMLSLPQNKQLQILRGLLRGDGSVDSRGNYVLSTSSLNMVGSVQLLCLRLGIIPSICVRAEAGTVLFGNHVANMAKSYAIHVKNLNGSLHGVKPSSQLVEGDRVFQHGWIDGCSSFNPLRSLDRESYDGFVYNLEVEEDHSYTTSACTVHNCTSTAVLEHIPEQYLPAIIKEMQRVCKRGLHGVDFHDTDKFDKTHVSIHPRDWWVGLFNIYAPGWPVEIVDKEELEKGEFPPELFQDGGKVKLNLGSYATMFHHGWINIDQHDLTAFANQYGYRFARHDLKNGFQQQPTGTVDLIFLHHVLEHFDYRTALALLRECRRLLKPDTGAMRLAVPDVAFLSESYTKWNSLSNFDEMSEACANAPTAAAKYHALLQGDDHKSFWDKETLERALTEAGFDHNVGVGFREWGFNRTGIQEILKETIEQTYGGLSIFADVIPKTS